MDDGRGEFLDRERHGGRKKERLAAWRELRDDAFDFMDESEIEHAIGFIEHKNLHLIETDVFLAFEVHQAARRGDKNIDAVR